MRHATLKQNGLAFASLKPIVVAAVIVATVLVGLVGVADAGERTLRYSTTGGSAKMYRQWSPVTFDGISTYKVTYIGQLCDRRGDGRHVRLYLYAYGGLYPATGTKDRLATATFGRGVRVLEGSTFANTVWFQLCTYDGGKKIKCTKRY